MKNRYEPEPLFNPMVIVLTLAAITFWRWRALGLTHPKCSSKRSRESVSALRAIFAAIKAGSAAQAEMLGRKETAKAAAEVMRLLSD